MVPTRVPGSLWTHAGGYRTHTVDLDLLVPSPCLLRPGEEVELAPDPPGRIGKNLSCSTPRTVLFQDLQDTQEAWEPSSERWLPPPGSGVAGGQPLNPSTPVNITMVLVPPGRSLLGGGTIPTPIGLGKEHRCSAVRLHTGAGWVGSRALIFDPSLVPGVASTGQQGGDLGFPACPGRSQHRSVSPSLSSQRAVLHSR